MPLVKTTDLEESVLNGNELDRLHFVNTRVRFCGRSMASSDCRLSAVKLRRYSMSAEVVLIHKKDKKKEEAPPPPTKGVYIFPNGDRYDGEYQHGSDGSLERNGYGVHTTTDGSVYEGEWKGDKMNGRGKLTHPSGALYEGEFVNNQFHGQGKYTWKNNSFYEGQFNENKMEGTGQFTDTEGQMWTGTFRYKAAPGLRFELKMN